MAVDVRTRKMWRRKIEHEIVSTKNVDPLLKEVVQDFLFRKWAEGKSLPISYGGKTLKNFGKKFKQRAKIKYSADQRAMKGEDSASRKKTKKKRFSLIELHRLMTRLNQQNVADGPVPNLALHKSKRVTATVIDRIILEQDMHAKVILNFLLTYTVQCIREPFLRTLEHKIRIEFALILSMVIEARLLDDTRIRIFLMSNEEDISREDWTIRLPIVAGTDLPETPAAYEYPFGVVSACLLWILLDLNERLRRRGVLMPKQDGRRPLFLIHHKDLAGEDFHCYLRGLARYCHCSGKLKSLESLKKNVNLDMIRKGLPFLHGYENGKYLTVSAVPGDVMAGHMDRGNIYDILSRMRPAVYAPPERKQGEEQYKISSRVLRFLQVPKPFWVRGRKDVEKLLGSINKMEKRETDQVAEDLFRRFLKPWKDYIASSRKTPALRMTILRSMRQFLNHERKRIRRYPNLMVIMEWIMGLSGERRYHPFAKKGALAERTIIHYGQCVYAGVMRILNDRPLQQLEGDEEFAADFIEDFITHPDKAESRIAYQAILRDFWYYLMNVEKLNLTAAVVADIGNPFVGRKIYITPVQVDQLLMMIGCLGLDDYRTRFVQSVFILGYWAGLRPTEIVALRGKDFDLGLEMSLLIPESKTRAGTRRQLPLRYLIPEKHLMILERFLVEDRQLHRYKKRFDETVFLLEPVDRSASIQSYNSVFPALNSVLKIFFGDAHISFYDLRHSFATQLFLRWFKSEEAGFDIKTIFGGDLGLEQKDLEKIRILFRGYSGEGNTYQRRRAQITIAALMGHLSPEMTFSTYNHGLHFVHRYALDQEIQAFCGITLKKKEWARLSGLNVNTISRVDSGDRKGLRIGDMVLYLDRTAGSGKRR